jgi:hypothetical protein
LVAARYELRVRRLIERFAEAPAEPSTRRHAV